MSLLDLHLSVLEIIFKCSRYLFLAEMWQQWSEASGGVVLQPAIRKRKSPQPGDSTVPGGAIILLLFPVWKHCFKLH